MPDDFEPIENYRENDTVEVSWGALGYVMQTPKPGDVNLIVFVEDPTDTIWGGFVAHIQTVRIAPT